MKRVGRWVVVGYAGVAYAAFVVVAVWAVGFLADAGVPHTVDGTPARPSWVAVPVDAGLLLLFGVQHSVMARAGFKRRVASVVPPQVERATYVLATALVLGLLFGAWRSLPATVWRVGAQPWEAAAWVLFGAGWVVAVAATFMVDHLDFLGIRQAVTYARRASYRAPSFTGRWLYAWVRHPMMLGLLVAFWATPRMTAGHLLFAVGSTAYVAVGLRFEERDLRRNFGEVYDGYADRVPSVAPRIHRRTAVSDGVATPAGSSRR